MPPPICRMTISFLFATTKSKTARLKYDFIKNFKIMTVRIDN